MLHARPIVGALVAAALLTAGCGSSDDPAPAKAAAATATIAAPTTSTPAKPAAPAPSKAEYVRRADRVCREARGLSHRANAVVAKAFAAKDDVRAADAIDQYMPLYIRNLETLKKLPQPAGDTKVLKGLLKIMDLQAQALVLQSRALRDGDQAFLQRTAAAQQQERQYAEDLGRQYGFRVCGRA
jgi:hypothetical protein